MKKASLTVEVIGSNPHRKNTITWLAGQIVTGMQGCRIGNIICALTAFEEDRSDVGIGDPARWLSHFAGLESPESGKSIDPWIRIVHNGQPVSSVASYRALLRSEGTR